MLSPRSAVRRAVDGLFELLYPGEESYQGSREALREVRGLTSAIIAGTIAAVVGIVLFRGDVPLWGPVSPGTLGLILVGLTTLIAAIAEHRRFPLPTLARWSKPVAWAQRVVNITAVALVHCGIAILLAGFAIAVLVRGFIGLRVDVFTGTMILVILSSAAAYITTVSAGKITNARLSVLFSLFMTGGIVVAMLTTTETDWWRLHFSELGVSQGASSFVFNATFIIGGLLFASIAAIMAPALEQWSDAAPPSNTRNVRLVCWIFVVTGVCLSLVGCIPTDVNGAVHVTFATTMAVAFGSLLVTLRWLLAGFARSFLFFSDTILVAMIVSTLLFWPMGYYNLAAFELLGVGIVFAWLIIFLRHVDASTLRVMTP